MAIIKSMETIAKLPHGVRGLARGLCLLGLVAGILSCAAPARQAQGLKDETYCLWLLWTKDPKLAAQAKSQMAQGVHFTVAARNLAQAGQKKVSLNTRCLPASRLGPQVLAQARQLKIGQVSAPFVLDKGTAWVMRTTDEHRLKGEALYEKGEYLKAEKELLADLKLHPAKAPTWHLVALCRSARRDYAGALKALDQALKWSPDSPDLWQDKATTLVYMGKTARAVPLYEKVLAAEPKNALAMCNLAWALSLEGKDFKQGPGPGAKGPGDSAPKRPLLDHFGHGAKVPGRSPGRFGELPPGRPTEPQRAPGQRADGAKPHGLKIPGGGAADAK